MKKIKVVYYNWGVIFLNVYFYIYRQIFSFFFYIGGIILFVISLIIILLYIGGVILFVISLLFYSVF